MKHIGPINPVYLYTAIADAIALLIGFAVIAWTDAQVELVLGLVSTLILLFTGVAVPTGRGVNSVAQEAYDLGIRDGKIITATKEETA